MLTSLLLTKNNASTLPKTLESLLPLGKILVGDRASTDNTVQVARHYGAKVVAVPPDDLSQGRNMLIDCSETEWVLAVEPWEVVINGLAVPEEPKPYSFQVVNNHVVTKETRLWHRSLGLHYENPVYESLAEHIPPTLIEKTLIFVTPHADNTEEKKKLLEEWCSRCPTLAVPHYYRAFLHLEQKEYRQFFAESNQFLFQGGDGIPAAMLQYYQAMTSLYVYKDGRKAQQALLPCLAAHPLMAEFWCLLGDIDYQQHRYPKAASFYENAILLGQRRLKSDPWPMDLTKYKKYPRLMIDNCQRMAAESRLLLSKRDPTRSPPP